MLPAYTRVLVTYFTGKYYVNNHKNKAHYQVSTVTNNFARIVIFNIRPAHPPNLETRIFAQYF